MWKFSGFVYKTWKMAFRGKTPIWALKHSTVKVEIFVVHLFLRISRKIQLARIQKPAKILAIFYFSVIRSRMLPPFISDAKDNHPTFYFHVIRSRMLPPFISDAKDKHPTFYFSVIQSRMLPPFISDAKDKHPTFIFSVIRSRMFPPFISDAKDKHPTFIFSVIRSRIYRHSFPTVKANTRHLFQPHTEMNGTVIDFH